jgi:hypothetical protein
MYISRSRMIKQRSGEDLDNILGPTIVCLSLAVALCLNFGLRVSNFRLVLNPSNFLFFSSINCLGRLNFFRAYILLPNSLIIIIKY